ncbi:membrane-associated protein, putative [Bodo saltans]|uniref:Membrane-associated protein, putative n=1 Tax=Bodo saltans TaxID=75058 RepID=A0A0S4IMC3_BODSA|nr:membrane-associated protein, putative [Bodo saltans]|eukprot:CUF42073.1 membrane-associated protein, putative [Bodo saltans]
MLWFFLCCGDALALAVILTVMMSASTTNAGAGKDQYFPFFFAPLPARKQSPTEDIQTSCRTACANISNDKALGTGGFVAWILSAAENQVVSLLASQLPKSSGTLTYYVLGGNRRNTMGGEGSLWYWTERPALGMAHNSRGLLFYNGTDAAAGGKSILYTNFPTNEPNNYGGIIETQLAFTRTTNGWNDINANGTNEVGGCICRHWTTLTPSSARTLSVSASQAFTLTGPTLSRSSSHTRMFSLSFSLRTRTLSRDSPTFLRSVSTSHTLPTGFVSPSYSFRLSASHSLAATKPSRLSASISSTGNTRTDKTTVSVPSSTLTHSSCRNDLRVQLYSLGTPRLTDEVRAAVSTDLSSNGAILVSSESGLVVLPDEVLRGLDASRTPLALLHSEPHSWQITTWVLQNVLVPSTVAHQIGIIPVRECKYPAKRSLTEDDGSNDDSSNTTRLCMTFLFAVKANATLQASNSGSSASSSTTAQRSRTVTGMTWMTILNPTNPFALAVPNVQLPFVCATQVQYLFLSLEISRSQADTTSQTTAVVVTSSSFVTSGGDVSGAVPMLFLSMLSCRDTVDSAQTAVQTLVSPFASLGVLWVAWGNIGLALAIVLFHYIVTVTLAKFRGVPILQDAAVISKFPGLSVTAMDYLLPGSILGSVAVLASRESAAESIASASVALSCALLMVVGLSAATIGYVLPRASWEAYLRVPLLTTLSPAGASSGTTTTACEQRCCAPYEHYFYPKGRWAPLSLRARFTPLMGWMRFRFGWVTIFQRCLLCTLAAATSLSGRPALCNAIVLFLAAAHLMTMLFYLFYRPLRYPMNTIIFPLSSALFAIVFILKYLDAFEHVSSVLQAVNGVAQFWRSCWVLWISRREAQWDTEDNIVSHRFVVRRLNKGEEEGSLADMSMMMMSEEEFVSCGNSQEMTLGNFAELTSPFTVHTTTLFNDGEVLLRPNQGDDPPANVKGDFPGNGVGDYERVVIWNHGRLASEFPSPSTRNEPRTTDFDFRSLQNGHDDEGPLPLLDNNNILLGVHGYPTAVRSEHVSGAFERKGSNGRRRQRAGSGISSSSSNGVNPLLDFVAVERKPSTGFPKTIARTGKLGRES